jgi:hypothetical protein
VVALSAPGLCQLPSVQGLEDLGSSLGRIVVEGERTAASRSHVRTMRVPAERLRRAPGPASICRRERSWAGGDTPNIHRPGDLVERTRKVRTGWATLPQSAEWVGRGRLSSPSGFSPPSRDRGLNPLPSVSVARKADPEWTETLKATQAVDGSPLDESLVV